VKFQDVYRAACAVIVNVEQEYGSDSSMYRKAVGGMNDIIALRCESCAGFGWNNPQFGGHTAWNKEQEGTEKCPDCYGSGFAPD